MKTRMQIVCVLAAMLLLCRSVLSVEVGQTERWDTGLLNGWTDEVRYAAALTNPGTYLQLSFPGQNILMPAEDGVAGGIDASGGIFSGNYVAAEVSGISFSIMTDGTVPATARLVLHSSESDREWSYAPLEISGEPGMWVQNVAWLDYGEGKWRLSGPGANEQKFLEDLRHVDRIGIRIQQNGTKAQVYCIDEFKLHGLKSMIKGNVVYKGYQSGIIKVMAVAVPDSWLSMNIGKISRAGVYEIRHLDPHTNYWVKAYMDANGNNVPDYWEPKGEYVSNAVYLVHSADDVNITMEDALTADGLPVWWVNQATGGDTNITADADDDGDGMSNLQEYLAGTDPKDGGSALKAVLDSKPEGVGVVLKWPSTYPGQRYQIWRCSDLTTGFNVIQTGIPATPPVNSFEDTTATGIGPYYYKIKLE